MTKTSFMMGSLILTAVACSTSLRMGAPRFETNIPALEGRIEAAVVTGDTDYLSTVYADDFSFTHGSGQVNTKEEMLKLVAFRPFRARVIKTEGVKITGNTAETRGTILVTRKPRPSEKGYQQYTIRYVRTYRYVNRRWQLTSHITTEETPPKPAT